MPNLTLKQYLSKLKRRQAVSTSEQDGSAAVDRVDRSQGWSPWAAGTVDNLVAQLVAQWSAAHSWWSQQNQRLNGETGWGGRIRTCECRYQKPHPAIRKTRKAASAQWFSSLGRPCNENRDTNRYTIQSTWL